MFVIRIVSIGKENLAAVMAKKKKRKRRRETEWELAVVKTEAERSASVQPK